MHLNLKTPIKNCFFKMCFSKKNWRCSSKKTYFNMNPDVECVWLQLSSIHNLLSHLPWDLFILSGILRPLSRLHLDTIRCVGLTVSPLSLLYLSTCIAHVDVERLDAAWLADSWDGHWVKQNSLMWSLREQSCMKDWTSFLESYHLLWNTTSIKHPTCCCIHVHDSSNIQRW